MTAPYVEQIWIDKIDARDLTCLQIAVDVGIFGHRVEHILLEVEQHHMQLWRGEYNSERFVVITQILSHPGGRELKIWSVGGKGYVKALDKTYTTLHAFAKKYQCRWITGLVKRKGFERLYARFKFKDLYRNWIVEI